MKTIFLTIISLVTLTLVSCGPSAEEKAAAEKVKMDSIAKATEEATRLKIANEQRVADSIAAAEASEAAENEMRELDKANLKQSLSDARTELRLAKEKLSSIKEFQLGRAQWEKDAQIEKQYKVIQSWEDEIERLQDELKKYE